MLIVLLLRVIFMLCFGWLISCDDAIVVCLCFGLLLSILLLWVLFGLNIILVDFVLLFDFVCLLAVDCCCWFWLFCSLHLCYLFWVWLFIGCRSVCLFYMVKFVLQFVSWCELYCHFMKMLVCYFVFCWMLGVCWLLGLSLLLC